MWRGVSKGPIEALKHKSPVWIMIAAIMATRPLMAVGMIGQSLQEAMLWRSLADEM